jgi:hypothetical protein
MEPLWSPVVAIGGDQRQIESAPKNGSNKRKPAVGYDPLPRKRHGKEEVDRSHASGAVDSFPTAEGVTPDLSELAVTGGDNLGDHLGPSVQKGKGLQNYYISH